MAETAQRISNMTRVEALLDDPVADISLNDLRDELNELAKLRQSSRLAFCKRLALAYMMVVGRRAGMDAPRDGGTAKFVVWCDKNIHSANNSRYSRNTITTYLTTGFASNPEKYFEDRMEAHYKGQVRRRRKDEVDRKFGLKLIAAAENPTPPKPPSLKLLRSKFELSSDVATEVNALMTAWEKASPEARKQFLYMVK